MNVGIIIAICVVIVAILIYFKFRSTKKDEMTPKKEIFKALDHLLQDDEDHKDDEKANQVLKKYKLNDSVVIELKQLYNTNDDVDEDDYDKILKKYI